MRENLKYRVNLLIGCLCSCISLASAQNIEYIKYGNFNQWVVRHIKESPIIGGKTRTIYEIAPDKEINGNVPYRNMGHSPWATSNVYARVAGINKTSNAVYPATRAQGNLCAKLCTQIESVKVLGVINMDVLVAGSIFLGEMIEPITSTSKPYSKMQMGVPFGKRPKALVFDYKVDMPATNTRTKSTGFSSKKTLQGRDSAVVFVFLQKRLEDADGNIHAVRVATGGCLFGHATDWTNGFELPLTYGAYNATGNNSWLGLRNGDNSYYACNSKGKMVPVREESWGDGSETPTHMIVMISAGKGEPYVGTVGLTLYVDNVGLKY